MTDSSTLMESPVSHAATDMQQRNPQPLVSIVLLSYNRPALLAEALASVRRQSHENLEIIVVDNFSPASAEVAELISQYENVRLMPTQKNLGYAAGMNKGIATASGDYVYLTEDDVVLEPNCIEQLVDYLDHHESADLAAPIIYNKTAKTIRCAGGDFLLGGVYRRKIHGAGERDAGQFPVPFAVNYIDGAAMFARREFWQEFKGFREEYFMYVDAVELCARVAKARKRMTIVPDAKVFHFEPAVAPTPRELEFHKLKNFFSLYLLHAPARVLPEFIFRYAVINGVRSLLRRNATRPQTFFKALLWVVARTPSILKERMQHQTAVL